MRPKNLTLHTLGKHYQELISVEPELPLELQVLLLRLASRDAKPTECGEATNHLQQPRASAA
jgi:hypothetical protein